MESAALAISSRAPERSIGTVFTMLANICWPAGPDPTGRLQAGVLIRPGLSAFRADFTFLQIHRPHANDRNAPLVALYTIEAGLPLDFAIEGFRMIATPSWTRRKASVRSATVL
jgi:hypothetical protein